MQIVTQLNVIMPNAPGNLANVSDRLRAAGVNIGAVSCTEGKPTTILHLIVDDVDSAKLTLQPIAKISTSDALAFKMKNKPGSIAAIGRACAGAQINIRNIYATTCGKEAMVYVVVEDSEEAASLLQNWEKTAGKLFAS